MTKTRKERMIDRRRWHNHNKKARLVTNREKRGLPSGFYGFHSDMEYDENGNIPDMRFTYNANNTANYFFTCEIKFDEGIIRIYKVCDDFFTEIGQKRFNDLIDKMNFDDFNIVYNI